jgi:hypothetical protein
MRAFSGMTEIRLFMLFTRSSIFQYSSIPMFDVLGCGYATRGSLWLDSDDTALVERRRI